MTRYERGNAARNIDGYYMSPHIPAARYRSQIKQQYRAAQAACLTHMRKAVANVDAMTLELFREGRRDA